MELCVLYFLAGSGVACLEFLTLTSFKATSPNNLFGQQMFVMELLWPATLVPCIFFFFMLRNNMIRVCHYFLFCVGSTMTLFAVSAMVDTVQKTSCVLQN